MSNYRLPALLVVGVAKTMHYFVFICLNAAIVAQARPPNAT
jgi:hypothetical protein